MGLIKYFFDSYAVIELINGNSNYAKYFSEPVLLTIFNLSEIYYSCLNEYTEEEAKNIYDKYSQCVVDIPDEILKDAMKFRKGNKKKNLSYADCIDYIYAIKKGIIFLTGDKEFQGIKNVEFVK